jgi:hypothetical protein
MKTKILLFCAVVAAGLSAWWLPAHFASDSDFGRRLRRSAESVLNSSNATVTLSSVTDFEWDRCYVFTPYTPLTEIDRNVGVGWSATHNTSIQSSDGIHLLLFLKGTNVVRSIDVNRKYADFKGLSDGNEFPHSNCTFGVKLDREARLVLVARPKINEASSEKTTESTP